MKDIIISCLVLFTLFLTALSSGNTNEILEKNKSDFAPIIPTLIKKGADTTFLNKIFSHPNTKFDPKYTRYNVVKTGKAPDYSKHFNARSISKTKDFLQKYDNDLMAAEMVFGVPKEIIASILWIETRHGGYTGYHHVVSVYLSTAMSNQAEQIQQNLENLYTRLQGDTTGLKEYEDKIYVRSIKKANWAMDQIIALQKIDSLAHIDVLEIEGSWAGAFGFSQFIPTSFVSWAYDGDGNGEIDLFTMKDAIFSTANYLKTNGWGDTEEEQKGAVWHYNNSDAYVNAVLTLAEKSIIEEPENSDSNNTNSNINIPLDKQVGN